MSVLLIGIVLTFLIEIYYIAKIVFDIRKMDKQHILHISLLEQNQNLKTEVTALQQKVIEAQKENEGIHFLWNRTIKENSQLRKEMEVAEKQLRYLAQKVVSEDRSEVERQDPVFWKSDLGQDKTAPQTVHEMSFQ